MNDLVIRNAKLINGDITDITVCDGKIVSLSLQPTDCQAKKIIDLKGAYYVSAGWIDGHTHCFSASPIYYDEPDLCGVNLGVTTLVDAGSVGADDIDAFYSIAQQAKTNVFAFINISKIGIISQNELSNMGDIQDELVSQAINKYPEFIKGIKARMSKSVVGDNGIEPLLRAKQMQKNNPLPLMVHVGNSPPNLDDIVAQMDHGDIITHCYNGKPNRILDSNNQLRHAVKEALARGVILDVGHGGESFSFDVALQAISLGAGPDIISSDIYYRNRINGPVYSLANVMTKFFCLGFSLKEIIERVTEKPAQLLNLKNKGHLVVGYDADLTIFSVKNTRITLSDAQNVTLESDRQFVPLAAIVGGECYKTKEGEAESAIHL